MFISSSYLEDAMSCDSLVDLVKGSHSHLDHVNFDSFAVSGCSGTLVASAFAIEHRKNIILVRKDSDRDNSHTSCTLEGGALEYERYVILDDFIASGDTVRRMIKRIEDPRRDGPYPKCVGIYLWKPSSFSTAERYRVEPEEYTPMDAAVEIKPVTDAELANAVSLNDLAIRPMNSVRFVESTPVLNPFLNVGI